MGKDYLGQRKRDLPHHCKLGAIKGWSIKPDLRVVVPTEVLK